MVEKGFLNKDKKQGRNTYTVFNEKMPKKLAISLDINVNDPKKLMEFILSSINDLPPCQNPSHTYFLVDPITGDSVFVEIRDNHPHIRVEK